MKCNYCNSNTDILCDQEICSNKNLNGIIYLKIFNLIHEKYKTRKKIKNNYLNSISSIVIYIKGTTQGFNRFYGKFYTRDLLIDHFHEYIRSFFLNDD